MSAVIQINMAERASLLDLATKAWDIHNILQTLYVALPEDSDGHDVPTRCLLEHVLGLTAPLAELLADLDFSARPKSDAGGVQ